MGRAASSDDALLAATPREPEAFGVFYRRHAEAVLAYLLYRSRDREAALDLTAEVFAVALEAAPRYRPGRAPARAWLFGIANKRLAASRRRQAIDDRARRRLGVRSLRFEEAELEEVERMVDLQRRRPPLELLVADLPPGEHDAVIARVVEERDYREIAARLGCSEAAARQRVSRGLARLAVWVRGLGS
jgi:RNA polymerase sigma factor (sigma-70 family)